MNLSNKESKSSIGRKSNLKGKERKKQPEGPMKGNPFWFNNSAMERQAKRVKKAPAVIYYKPRSLLKSNPFQKLGPFLKKARFKPLPIHAKSGLPVYRYGRRSRSYEPPAEMVFTSSCFQIRPRSKSLRLSKFIAPAAPSPFKSLPDVSSLPSKGKAKASAFDHSYAKLKLKRESNPFPLDKEKHRHENSRSSHKKFDFSKEMVAEFLNSDDQQGQENESCSFLQSPNRPSFKSRKMFKSTKTFVEKYQKPEKRKIKRIRSRSKDNDEDADHGNSSSVTPTTNTPTPVPLSPLNFGKSKVVFDSADPSTFSEVDESIKCYRFGDFLDFEAEVNTSSSIADEDRGASFNFENHSKSKKVKKQKDKFCQYDFKVLMDFQVPNHLFISRLRSQIAALKLKPLSPYQREVLDRIVEILCINRNLYNQLREANDEPSFDDEESPIQFYYDCVEDRETPSLDLAKSLSEEPSDGVPDEIPDEENLKRTLNDESNFSTRTNERGLKFEFKRLLSDNGTVEKKKKETGKLSSDEEEDDCKFLLKNLKLSSSHDLKKPSEATENEDISKIEFPFVDLPDMSDEFLSDSSGSFVGEFPIKQNFLQKIFKKREKTKTKNRKEPSASNKLEGRK